MIKKTLSTINIVAKAIVDIMTIWQVKEKKGEEE